MNYLQRIIVPLDVPTAEQAIALLDLLPGVSFWKVGLELFVATGADIVKILRERGKKIFLDLKFHDIPNTVAGACRSASQYEVDLLTLHISAGREALTGAKNAIANSPNPPKLLGITVLTSLSNRQLNLDLKIPLELTDYALQMALMGQESGLDGAVCSPREVKQLRAVCGDNFLLVCPGVRPSWSAQGDQSRIMTPAQAFQAGADYLVIGRPITTAPNPQQAWSKIGEELASI
ncbi:MAG: orotidine-5'-phosphate decarboxylase [Chlorogloea purpurea SAG 13.99]|nr:orotidine-5'-phosphate decarboxylase [Chlorogloea purpurea SAG 13.99]